MSRTIASTVTFLAALVLLPCAATATSGRAVELTCPVCGSKAWGFEVASTNSFGGQDRDFLGRARGDQVILLVPVTCPSCLYSNYTGDFEKAVPDELKKKILDDAVLEAPPHVKRERPGEALSRSEFPAWVRHDLILQVMALKGEDKEALLNQCMNVSWAVRLEDNPFWALSAGLDDSGKDWVDAEQKKVVSVRNQALNEIALGRHLAAGLAEFPPERRRAAALLAGSLLRNHGENVDLLEKLPSILEVVPEEGRKQAEDAVKKSVDLERSYQRKALSYMAEVLPTLVGEGKPPQKLAIFQYLAGELCRRLGESDEAVGHFDKAAAVEGAPDWLEEYITEQKALAKAAD